MIKEEALIQFKLEHQEWLMKKKEAFIQKMEASVQEIIIVFRQLFQKAREEMEQKEKEPIMFFYFSFLRNSLFQNHYHLLLHLMDMRWYLDKEPIMVEGDLDFLFQELFKSKEELLANSKKYLGKVNQYDVEYFFQDLVVACNVYLVEQLRFLFRDIEANEDFEKIKKQQVWYMRYGEYRDYSEIIVHVDRVKKSQKDWESKIKKIKNGQSEQELAISYWYSLESKNSECKSIFMPFITFENCILEQIDFTNSVMKGARFLNCVIKNCIFNQCNLQQAEFKNCTWENNEFIGANVAYSVFEEQVLPFVHLEPDQLQTIFVERGE